MATVLYGDLVRKGELKGPLLTERERYVYAFKVSVGSPLGAWGSPGVAGLVTAGCELNMFGLLGDPKS